MTTILPTINASLNATSGVLLCSAFGFIKAKKWRAHGYTMVAATVVSAIFLACYLYYHAHYPEQTFKAHGWLKGFYFFILIPHVLLAMGMIPMIYITLLRAYRRDWISHRRISVPTFWIWLYVSITGVIVYLMLYHTNLTSPV